MTGLPDWPLGTPVVVTDDDGVAYYSETRSKPWCLGDGTSVILLDGIAGPYLLERVARIPDGSRTSLPHFANRPGAPPTSFGHQAALRLADLAARIGGRAVVSPAGPDLEHPRWLVVATTDPDEITTLLKTLARLDASAEDEPAQWDTACSDRRCGLPSGHGGEHTDGERWWPREEP